MKADKFKNIENGLNYSYSDKYELDFFTHPKKSYYDISEREGDYNHYKKAVEGLEKVVKAQKSPNPVLDDKSFKDLLKRYCIENKNKVHYSDGSVEIMTEENYDPHFGKSEAHSAAEYYYSDVDFTYEHIVQFRDIIENLISELEGQKDLVSKFLKVIDNDIKTDISHINNKKIGLQKIENWFTDNISYLKKTKKIVLKHQGIIMELREKVLNDIIATETD